MTDKGASGRARQPSATMARMNRRNVLTGLFAAGVEAEAQSPAPDPAAGSLYIPKPHLVEDRQFLHDFMDEFAFVDLVTAAPSLRITHIPVWLDRTQSRYGTIHGHLSRQNPQSKTFDGQQSGVIVFRGPHSYISPAWYAKKADAVPTWNFAVVHATGKLRPVSGKKELNDLLAKLIGKFETYEGTGYDFSKISDDYKYGLMADQQSGNRQQQDVPIQAQRPIIDVLHVHAHPGLEIEVVASGQSPQAGQSRAHPQAAALPLFVLLHFIGNGGARAHQRHVAA